MTGKSADYRRGFQDALILAMDIFESRTQAIYDRKWLRKKDITLVVAILDAAFRSRDKFAELGPRGMNLVLCRDGSFMFCERKKKKEKKSDDNGQRIDSGADHEL